MRTMKTTETMEKHNDGDNLSPVLMGYSIISWLQFFN